LTLPNGQADFACPFGRCYQSDDRVQESWS
jgi:hypothetical protein